MTSDMSLEDTLKAKLERGEITQEEYDNLMKKFGDLDLLGSTISSEDKQYDYQERKDKSWSISGSATRDGGEISDDVRVSGRLRVNGPLKCPNLKISGSASFYGDLSVVDNFKISGAADIRGVGKFGGVSKVSGKLTIDSDAYFTNSLKISGKAEFGNDLIIGEDLKISGKLEANSIQSKSSIHLSGVMNLANDLVATEFISSGGKSDIGGNLEAEIIEIAKRYREREGYSDSMDDTENIDSLPDLGRFISNIVTKVLPGIIGGSGTWGTPSIFHVVGSVLGSQIDISYANIEGDIEGDDVIIGPKVTVGGVIRYKNTITVPENHNFTIEQINE